ncbi:hypothetical protein ACWD0J_38925 [Streptomyces sp. NPDC003011]
MDQDDWELCLKAFQDCDEFALSLRMDTAVLPSPDFVSFLTSLERRLVDALPAPDGLA